MASRTSSVTLCSRILTLQGRPLPRVICSNQQRKKNLPFSSRSSLTGRMILSQVVKLSMNLRVLRSSSQEEPTVPLETCLVALSIQQEHQTHLNSLSNSSQHLSKCKCQCSLTRVANLPRISWAGVSVDSMISILQCQGRLLRAQARNLLNPQRQKSQLQTPSESSKSRTPMRRPN